MTVILYNNYMFFYKTVKYYLIGNLNFASAPCCNKRFFKEISPSWSCIIFLTNLNPKPLPLFPESGLETEKNRVNKFLRTWRRHSWSIIKHYNRDSCISFRSLNCYSPFFRTEFKSIIQNITNCLL